MKVIMWRFGNHQLNVQVTTMEDGFTTAVIASCNKCKRKYTAVSGNVVMCKNLVVRKHRENAKLNG
jgi:hypothetical protein